MPFASPPKRERQIAQDNARANALLPDLKKLRRLVDPERSKARARIQVPLLGELLRQNDMGGAGWCDQFPFGFPMMGGLGEPGVFPPSLISTENLAREEIFRLASSMSVAAKGGQGPRADDPWREATSQV